MILTTMFDTVAVPSSLRTFSLRQTKPARIPIKITVIWCSAADIVLPPFLLHIILNSRLLEKRRICFFIRKFASFSTLSNM